MLDQLQARLGPGKLKEMMERLRQETGGLLNDDAVIALVADELGMTETPFSPLAELTEDRPVFTRCCIGAIENTREFRSRDRTGKLRKLRVMDGSTELVMTLWDEETVLVEQLGLKPGTRVRILGAVLRTTRFGQQIHVGRSGFIVLDEDVNERTLTGCDELLDEDRPSEKRDIRELSGADERVDVKGVILSITNAGRGRQKATTIRLFDGTGECDIIIPDGTVAPLPELDIGLELEFAKTRIEHRSDRIILHCDRRSSIRIV